MKKIIIYTLLFLSGLMIYIYVIKIKPIIITVNGVYSLNHHSISQFSISKFKKDHQSLTDIRPNSHEEVTRFCCDLKEKHQGSRYVLFNMSDTNYVWNLCKLDTSIVANDSLNSLSFEEKIRYIQTKSNHPDDFSIKQKLPFIIEEGYVYQLFGIDDLNGSLYFCLDSGGELIVQFTDKGPW